MRRRTFLKSVVAVYCTPIVMELAPMLMRPAAVVDGEPIKAAIQSNDYYWSGAIDSDWSNPGNWQGGEIPTASANVFIRGKVDMGANAAPVSNLTQMGGTLTISRDYKGTIGTVTGRKYQQS